MKTDQSEPIVGGQSQRDESLSEADLVAQMMGDGTERQEEEAEEEAEETEETTEEQETEEVAEAEEETEDDEADTEAIDFDNLTDEQWEIVRTQLRSKAAADIQRLKREAKAKDAQIATLQNQQTAAAADPEPAESRFLAGIDTPEKLNEKVSALKKLAKDTERILDDHEDYSPSDLIDVGDKAYTKQQLKELKREVRETLDEAVPYMAVKFQRSAIIDRDHEGVLARLKSEVRELEDENSEVAKTYKGLTESELFKNLFKAFPESRPVLTLLAGHGAKAILAKAAKPGMKLAATGKQPKANPPSSPSGAAAAIPARSAGVKGSRNRLIEDAQRRYEESPTQANLIALGMAEQS